jgi:hypothetical protein
MRRTVKIIEDNETKKCNELELLFLVLKFRFRLIWCKAKNLVGQINECVMYV